MSAQAEAPAGAAVDPTSAAEGQPQAPSKFVVAVDSEEVSAYAFQWALSNLFKPKDHVTLITATFNDASLPSADITAGEFATPMGVTDPLVTAEISARATALVDKYMKLCDQAQLGSEGKVVEGSPGARIVEEAERISADAVVVGSHGRNVLGRTFLGSISDYVRHHAYLPVVVVRFPKEGERGALEAQPASGRKIVAAVDDSVEASLAFTWALEHFVRAEDSLLILHIMNPVVQPTAIGTDQLGMEDVYVPPDTTARASVEALGASEKLVEVFMKQAADTSKAKCEGKVVSGATHDKILHELTASNADVVVIGSHAHDVIQRTFLGSVSDFLAHTSPCPVIFVKPPKKTGAAPPSGKPHAV